MNIAILGSGLMGSRLGLLLAEAGHTVTFSYSRNKKKLQQLAERAGENGSWATPAEAVASAEVVLLAVHWSRVHEVLLQAGSLAGRIVISCVVPLDVTDSHLAVGHNDSGAQQIAKLLPESQLVAAFQTTPSEILETVFRSRGKDASLKPSVLFCSNAREASRIAAMLIKDTGFNPVNVGSLKNARYTEPFAMLTVQLAWFRNDGPMLTYQFRLNDQAIQDNK